METPPLPFILCNPTPPLPPQTSCLSRKQSSLTLGEEGGVAGDPPSPSLQTKIPISFVRRSLVRSPVAARKETHPQPPPLEKLLLDLKQQRSHSEF
ncbi:Hypothetical predicted protein [Podarcis lilfordi]|uniref:Uncharacterized protein n=1 Tax=Podarcis lilfordi TaxID=74358 RepID=A0AA35NYX8_9SAUR|nr:Hypothetical predicted protein [Podarcis lilfordi]